MLRAVLMWLTVKDGNECAVNSNSVTVTEPTLLVVNAVPGTIQCPGGTTNVAVSATGGNPPYTGVGIFTANAGSHTYSVTDSNGCTSSVTINIAMVQELRHIHRDLFQAIIQFVRWR